MIGGFVVLFSIIISMLSTSNVLHIIANFLKIFHIPNYLSMSFLAGFFEVTNGLFYITTLNVCSFKIKSNALFFCTWFWRFFGVVASFKH